MSSRSLICFLFAFVVFVIFSPFTVSGQTHKTTNLGFVCQSKKECKRCNGSGKIQPNYTWPMITCPECIGVSNDALWKNPCPSCGRSRKIRSRDFNPPGQVTCPSCNGKGNFKYGPRLQVADRDFPNQMSWQEAMVSSQSLGNGWRLPTIDELNGIYSILHKNGKGEFSNEEYWSSTHAAPPDLGHAVDAKCLYFGDGSITNYSKKFKGSFGLKVRAVRVLP